MRLRTVYVSFKVTLDIPAILVHCVTLDNNTIADLRAIAMGGDGRNSGGVKTVKLYQIAEYAHIKLVVSMLIGVLARAHLHLRLESVSPSLTMTMNALSAALALLRLIRTYVISLIFMRLYHVHSVTVGM